MFRFKCTSCGEWHEGMPTFGASAPLYYYSVPDREREKRYSALYKSMPIWERLAFGLTTLAFTSLMIWLFFRKHA